MQCKSCGTNIEPGNKFCENCGAPVPAEPISEELAFQDSYEANEPEMNFTSDETSPANSHDSFTSDPQSAVDTQPHETEKAKKKINIPLIASIAVVAAVLVIALVVRFGGFFDKKDSVTNIHDTSTSQSDEQTTTRAFMGEDNDGITESNAVEPDFLYNSVTYYVKPIEGLNLRKGPGADYGTILTIKRNEAVEIMGGTDLNEDWAYVYYSAGGVYGWLATEYLTANSQTPSNPETPYSVNYYDENSTYTVYVRPAVGLNLRTGPGEDHSRITLLEEGSVLTVLGVSNDDGEWIYINFGDLYGFVKSEYVNALN